MNNIITDYQNNKKNTYKEYYEMRLKMARESIINDVDENNFNQTESKIDNKKFL